MNITAYSLANFITFATTFSLAIFVYLSNRRSAINRIFSIYSLSIAQWAVSSALHSTTHSAGFSLFLAKFMHVGVPFIPVLFFHFCLDTLEIYPQHQRKLMLGYVIAAFFTTLSLGTDLLISQVRPKLGYPFFMDGGLLYPLVILHFVVYASFGLYALWRGIQTATGKRKNQLRYLFSGSFVGYLLGASSFFPVYNITVFPYPYGSYGICGYVLITTYAILKFNLMDIRMVISRAGISLAVYSLAFGIPFYLGYKSDTWFIPTLIAVLFAIPASFVYRYFRIKADNILLAEQRRYQNILVQAAAGMVREHNLNRLIKLTVYIVKKTVRINCASLFLHDKGEEAYLLRVLRDSGRMFGELRIPSAHPFILYLKKKKEPFLYETLPLEVRRSLQMALPMSLIVPSFVEDELLGFIVLGEKINGKQYTTDDINVFQILSHHAALAIENCLFFDEFKNAQEKVFTAEKLASIGGMADGVAHQVKNRLNHFSVASGELKFEISDFMRANPEVIAQNPDLRQTFEYFTHIAESFLDNVKRTDGIIRGILNFARVEEKDTELCDFSLRETIDLSLELLKVKHEITTFPLTLELGVDSMYGVKSQVMESIYNLLDNAYEAIRDRIRTMPEAARESFSPRIVLRSGVSVKGVLIEIEDNGSGIKDEDKHKIFAPFFTTKSSFTSGTGIGMYVVRRIVEENHRGRVWFKSHYGVGTTLYLELPQQGVSVGNNGVV